MGVVIAFRRNYAKKIDPCRMLVWLGRRTLQNRATTGSGQYTLLSGRPVQTGQVSSNSNLLRPRVNFTINDIFFAFSCICLFVGEYVLKWKSLKWMKINFHNFYFEKEIMNMIYDN